VPHPTVGWTGGGRPDTIAAMRRLLLLATLCGPAFVVGTGAAVTTPIASACNITAPANITKSNDPNQAGAATVYNAPTTTGADCATITCSPASGSFFPLGKTIVTCSASGDPGSRAVHTVTVNDTQPPTVLPPPNRAVATDAGKDTAQVTLTNATASDNAPGVKVTCSRQSGDLLPIGATTITCTATDTTGNTATGSYTITVLDGEKPTLTVPEPITVDAPGATAVSYVAAADDNSGSVTTTCNPVSGTSFSPGSTDVSCTATDAAGNATAKFFTVTVRTPAPTSVPPPDTVAPTLTAVSLVARMPLVRYTLGENATTRITVQRCTRGKCRTVSTVVVSDGAGRHLTAVAALTGKAKLRRATYRVRLTATDAAGNRATSKLLTLRVR